MLHIHRDLRVRWSGIRADSIGAGAGVALLSFAVGAGVTHTTDRRVAFFLGSVVIASAFFAVSRMGVAVLTTWVILEPVLFAFVRYPRSHSLITFDRLWIVASISCLLVAPRITSRWAPHRAVYVGLWWLLLSFGCRAVTTSHQLQNVGVWLDAIVLPVILFMLARAYLRTHERLVVTVRAFAIAGAFLGLLGILERSLGFELASLSGGTPRFDLAIGLIRVSGPYAVPEVYALALLICLAATLCWIQIVGRSVFLIGWGIAAVEIAAIGLTFFRAAWIGAVFVVFAAFGMRRARPTRAAVTAVVLGVLLLVLYSQLQHVAAFSTRIHNTQNVQTRFATYDEALSIFAKSPVFGVGVNRYTSAALQLPTNADAVPYPHSSFLGLLAEQGAVGVLPLVFLLFAVTWLLRSFNRTAVEDEIDAAFGAFATGAAFAYLLMSLTLTMLPYGPTNGMFALVLGAVAGRGERDVDSL